MAAARPRTAEDRHSWGALVGWKLEPGGDQLQLVMQTVASPEARREGDLDSLHMLLTRQQAILLANYLYEVTGTTRREARRGALARLLG